jgi:hypothetical protein
LSTATEERLVSSPETSVLFMCRRSDLRLVKHPRYPIYGPAGRKVGEERGEILAFREGVLRVPKDGEVELEDGRKISSAEAIEFLDGHRLKDSLEEGFWRVDPTAPPVSQGEISKLLEISYDEDLLLALIAQEEAGWNRDALIVPAKETLERLREVKAKVEAEARPKGK